MDNFFEKSNQLIQTISNLYPCRQEILAKLLIDLNLGRNTGECALPESIFIYGDRSTGKTVVITELLKNLAHKTLVIDSVECYTTKILYETILNGLFDYEIDSNQNYQSYKKCDNSRDFIDTMKTLNSNRSYVLMFDDAQRLRDLEANVLSIFLRLREMCNQNICCIFVSSLPFEKLYPIGSFPMPITVHWINYTQKEIHTILMVQYELYEIILNKRFLSSSSSTASPSNSQVVINVDEHKRRHGIINSLQLNFYENYFNLFLNTFYRTCRDLNELKLISRDCFVQYCEPIIIGTVDPNDVRMLYKNIAVNLKSTVNTIYRRIDHQEKQQANELNNQQNKNIINNNLEIGDLNVVRSLTATATTTTTPSSSQQLELPYYAKYLLIAAFLASHNDVKLDKRLFLKHHGKKRKTLKSIRANEKVSEKLAIQLGPKSFPIDRMMAIFYSIVEERVPLTCNLMAQIPSLVHLKLLNFISGESNIMDGTARLQCIVSLEFILQIGRNVGFNVRQYLGDFI